MTLKEAKLEADKVGGIVVFGNLPEYYYVIDIKNFNESMGYSPYVSKAAIQQQQNHWKQLKEEFKLKCEKMIDDILKNKF